MSTIAGNTHLLDIPDDAAVGEKRIRALMDLAIQSKAREVLIRAESGKALVVAARLVRDLKAFGFEHVSLKRPKRFDLPEKVMQAFWLAGLDEIREETTLEESATPNETILPDYFSAYEIEIDGQRLKELEINPTFQCNQRCEFCSTRLPHGAPSVKTIRRFLDEQIADGVRRIIISGGEPTLLPDLEALIEYAKTNGIETVTLNTNGVLLTKGRLQSLLAAGVDRVFLSLHAPEAKLSDAVTRMKGGFEKTIAALDACLEAGVFLLVNCVLTKKNSHAFSELAHFLLQKAEQSNQTFRLNLSLVSPAGSCKANYPTLAPKLSEMRPIVTEAFRLLYNSPVTLGGLESRRGAPLCIVDDDPMLLGKLGQVTKRTGFIQPPVCGRCRLKERCFGLREAYVALYGVDEVKPFS